MHHDRRRLLLPACADDALDSGGNTGALIDSTLVLNMESGAAGSAGLTLFGARITAGRSSGG